MEIAGAISIRDLGGPLADYPSETTWDTVWGERCLPVVETELGVKLDPFGRYGPSGLKPTEESWNAGDRDAWCGVVKKDPTDDGRLPAFTGKIAELDQSYLFDIGTCLFASPDAPVAIVPCSDNHHYEAIGDVDLAGRYEQVPTEAQWNQIVRADCGQLAATYLGDPIPRRSPLKPSLLPHRGRELGCRDPPHDLSLEPRRRRRRTPGHDGLGKRRIDRR